MKNKKFFKIFTLLLVLLAGVTAVFTLTSAYTKPTVKVGKVEKAEVGKTIKVPITIENPSKVSFANIAIGLKYDPSKLEFKYKQETDDEQVLSDGWNIIATNDKAKDATSGSEMEPGTIGLLISNSDEVNYESAKMVVLNFKVLDGATGKQDIKITKLEVTGALKDGEDLKYIDVIGEEGYINIEAPVNLDTVKLADESKDIKLDMSGQKTGQIEIKYEPYPTTSVMNLQASGDQCDQNVATIGTDGKVTARKSGKSICKINAFGKDVGEVTITVKTSVTDVKIEGAEEITLSKDETAQLKATVYPPTADDKTVTWSSSNPSVVEVNATTGEIKALTGGEANILVTTKDGKKTAKIKVIVNVPLSSFTLDVTGTIELIKGGKGKEVNIIPNPSDATIRDTDVKWTSSDNEAVSVEKNTAKKATITAKSGKKGVKITATINGKSQSFYVDVNVPISGIDITPSEDLRLIPGAEVPYKGTILPVDNTEGKTITWSVENPEGVEVVALSDNKIVAKNPGTAKVTAKVETQSGKTYAKTITVKVLVPVSDVNLDPQVVKLATTDTKTLKLIVNYPDGTAEADKEDYTVAWESSNPKVATVDENGKVTPVSVGTTKITAKLSNGKEASAEVEVFEKVKNITVKDSKVELNRGEKATIEATVNPENATIQNITWTVDDPSVATINVANNHRPVITAVNGGTTTIRGEIKDKDNETIRVAITVTVKVPITKVVVKNGETVVNDKTITLEKNGDVAPTVKLTATVLPEDTTENKTITWSVENPEDKEVIAIDADGNVTGLKGGYAYVTAKAGSVTAKVKIYVKVPIKEFKLVHSVDETFEIRRTDSLQLQTVITPADTTENTKITWTSSNTKVATVDENGKVTGVGKGVATITGRLENGMTVKVDVTVYIVEVEEIKFTDSDDEEIAEIIAYRTINKDIASLLNVYPKNATELSPITWTSSDEKVVKVNENGELEPVALGTAEITAKMGDKEATIKVVVKEIKLESISVKQDISKIKIGESIDLEIVKNPYNATEDVTFKYETSDKTIVKVDENGKLSAVGVGTAEITITASNGVKVTYKVTVEGTESPNTSVKSLIPYGISSLAFLGGIAMTIRKLKENEITLM